jgi:hypothetical protein
MSDQIRKGAGWKRCGPSNGSPTRISGGRIVKQVDSEENDGSQHQVYCQMSIQQKQDAGLIMEGIHEADLF